MTKAGATLVVLAIGVLSVGCSSYYGSESSAKTLTSPFTSTDASDSSGNDNKDTSYREDVRDYSATAVESGGTADDIDRGLAEVARRYGISDWRASDATWVAIGAGGAKARVDPTTFDGYKRALGRSDSVKMALMQRGYDGVR